MNDEKDLNAAKHFGASWADNPNGHTPKAEKPSAESLEQTLDRVDQIVAKAREVRERWQLWAAGQPQTKVCSKHPNRTLKIDDAKSADKSFRETEADGEDRFFAIYHACPECTIELHVVSQSNWLSRAGVPDILLHASFKTFRVECDQDRENLNVAKAFVAKAKGVLIMIGNRGDGKSMLAVATLREFLGGQFWTQNNLLLELRRGYRDPKAEDVIRKCQLAKCLVIDNFGLSMGGRDELPMLQSIIDHRYGAKLPIILTSTLTLSEIYCSLGKDLESRLKQATYKVLQFTGTDSRSAERQTYLAD